MYNPYLPKLAKIKKISQETPDVKLFTFQFVKKIDQIGFSFWHGQFLMLGLVGFGEAAFDICSSTAKLSTFDLTVRRVGTLTEKLHQLKVGDIVTVRGPYGNGLPENVFKNKELLLIGGGVGFIVMRSFILDYLAGKLKVSKLNVFYGCSDDTHLLYEKEYGVWFKKVGFNLALDKPTNKYSCKKGVITTLFNDAQDFTDTVALAVGPPVMYKFIIE